MIRYRANPVSAKLKEASMDEFRLEFNQPLRGITPGQFAVLYQGEVCLGGGIIKRTW
jgi:tRNA-specific 2-thiouridylase